MLLEDIKPLTKVDLEQVEKFADKIFKKLNIDVEFTKHFLDRVNDKRNGKQISVPELIKIFREVRKKHGKKISELGNKAQAVMNDITTDINIPFVLEYDPVEKDIDLVSKTIMRKKEFKTSNTKFKV